MNKRMICFALAAMLLPGLAGTARADEPVPAQTDCDSVYCFTAEALSQSGEQVMGICVLELPEPETGTVMLGPRVIRVGDILTAGQVEQMTFRPLLTEQDAVAVLSYLPVYESYVADTAQMTISIRGKKDEAPVAEDFALETYKNLPNEGRLKAYDPEGQELSYTVTRQPRRGTLEMSKDGTFVYTPKKNKVGVDSFTYTVTDPAGQVSREATVTVSILKPTQSERYTDTVGQDCRFEAEWLRNTGLFTGEDLNGTACFYPDKTVSRGQFLAMVTQLLQLPMDRELSAQAPEDVPDWLRPYYLAALRCGMTAGLPQEELFRPEDPITADTVAVLLHNALDLPVAVQTMAEEGKSAQPAWAEAAVQALAQNGITFEGMYLTRGEMAKLLYQVSRIASTAPGLAAYRN